MKIFVTGATGFVGGYIVKALASSVNHIYAVTRKKNVLNIENVTWLLSSNLADEVWLANKLEGVDVVIHAAAYAHQTRETSEDDRKKFIVVNKNLAETVFIAAKQKNVKQFIFISSIGAIKSLSSKFITEKTRPEPTNDYGKSKYLAEESLAKLSYNSPINLTIIRPCLIYGAGNPGNMERLSKLVDSNIPLPFRSVRARRSFLYVKNLTSFIESILLNKASFGEDFIIADNEILILPDLINLIATAKKASVYLIYFPEWGLKFIGRLGDLITKISGKPIPIDSYSVSRLLGSLPCSNNKAKNLLDWEPPYNIETAIEETYRND